MAPVLKAAEALNAQFAMMQVQLAGVNGAVDPVITKYRDGMKNVSGSIKEAVGETGAFRVGSLKAESAVSSFTTALQKQDVTVKTAAKNRRLFNEVLKEQYRIQRTSAMEWTTSGAKGTISADVFVPKNAPRELESFSRLISSVSKGQMGFGEAARIAGMRIGLMSEIVRSAGHNMINLGKNTQWAGRQLMVGFSIPIMAAAAGTAALAYNIEKELTRVARVYDTTSTAVKTEQNSIKNSARDAAREVANEWGMAAAETLDITAQLASAGSTGNKLIEDTKIIAEISVMGELNRQDAIKAGLTINTVFAKSNISLADSFKYLNDLENSTLVTSQDMVTAIPKLAGIVQTLGGDITDVGTLMAAARGAGINAAEAANTLKSISFRDVAPTSAAIKSFEALTNVNFSSILEQTDGKVIPTITALQKAMSGLSKIEKVKIFKDLQGLFQGSKALSIFDQFFNEETGGASEQVQRAIEVGQRGAEGWAGVWDQEARTLQESLPNRFKRAVETIKTDLAKVGTPFLEIATDVIEAVTRMLGSFEKIGEGKKKAILLVAGLLAVAGPLIMLSGLFLNFAGTVVRSIGSIGMILSRFKSVNVEQKTAELLAKSTSGAYISEANSVKVLNAELGKLRLALVEVARAQHQAAGTKPPMSINAANNQKARKRGENVGGVFQEKSGQAKYSTGGILGVGANKKQIAEAVEVAHLQGNAINNEKRLEAARKKSNIQLGGTAFLMSSIAAIGVAQVAPANAWGMALAAGVGVLPLAMPLLNGIINKVNDMATKMSIANQQNVKFGAGVNASRKLMTGLAAAAGPIGIAILAAAATWSIFSLRAKQVKKDIEAVNNAGDDFVGLVGGTPLRPGQYLDGAGQAKDTAMSLADQFREKNKQGTKELEKLGKQKDTGALKDYVIKIGFDVFAATKDAKKARQAIDAALAVAGSSVKIDVDWKSPAEIERLRKEMVDKISSRAVEVDFAPKFTEQDKGDIRAEAERLAETAGRVSSGAITAAAGKAEFQNAFKAYTDKIDAALSKYKPEMGDMDIAIFEKFGVKRDNIQSIREALIANKDFSTAIANGTSPALIQLKQDMGSLIPGLAILSKMTAEELDIVNNQDVGDVTKFANVMKYIGPLLVEAAGKAGTTAEEIDGIGGAAKGGAEDLALMSAEAVKAAKGMDNLQSAARGQWEKTASLINEFAAQQYADQMEAQMDRLQASGEKRLEGIENRQNNASDAFDLRKQRSDDKNDAADKRRSKSWDNIMESHKAKWEKRKAAEDTAYEKNKKRIEDTIKAEQTAEESRQKIFEAEKKRVQRLSELYSNNIDFNAALSSGKMDEAAKIGSNTSATVEQWALEDSADSSGTASEKRVAALEKSMESLDAKKNARDKALEDQAAKEEKDLDRRKARDDEAVESSRKAADRIFENQKKSSDKAFENERKNQEKSNKANETRLKKRQDQEKRALDLQLAALVAYIPKNENELKGHVVRLERAYNEHGGTLRTKSQQWSGFLTAAMAASGKAAKATLKNDINWAQFGQQAATDFIQGAFGMSVAQFTASYATGAGGIASGPKASSPKAGTAGTADPTKVAKGGLGGRHDGGEVFHGGGMPGGGRVNMGISSGTRTGYPRSAKKFPSEVDTRLRVGEYVVQRKAVQQFGVPFMEAINGGSMPTYHKGGPVKPSPGAKKPTGNKGPLGLPGLAGAVFSAVMQTALKGAFANGAGARLGAGSQSGSPQAAGPGTGAVFSRDGNWPPAVMGQLSSNTAAARAYIARTWPSTRNGGDPSLNRQDAKSDHGRGKALDIFPGSKLGQYASGKSLSEGWAIANWFTENAKQFGTKYVIWQKQINSGSGWRDYSRYGDSPGPTLGHYDHDHVSFRHGGGLTGDGEKGNKLPPSQLEGLGLSGPFAMPGLKVGGKIKYDNTMANLHKNESVLTAPLTTSLERGIKNLDQAGSTKYSIQIDLRGAFIKEDVNIERAVEAALNKKESRLGRSRKIK